MTLHDFIQQSEAAVKRFHPAEYTERRRELAAWRRQQLAKVERREGAAQLKEGVQS